MAIAAVFEFPGEPAEKYHKVFEAGDAIVDQPSRLYHVCYRTPTGFTVIDIWADEQSFAAFGETLGPAVRNAGLDARPAVYPRRADHDPRRHPVDLTITRRSRTRPGSRGREQEHRRSLPCGHQDAARRLGQG